MILVSGVIKIMETAIHGQCSLCSSYTCVACVYSRDRYEIIGLRKISHFIKQPCRNACLEKPL